MSKIITLFKGEFVQVDLVDETIELTVEDNVYSRSEATELLIELTTACSISKIATSMAVNETYSEQMQDELEPIDCVEPIKEEVIRWMTEGTAPHMSPRSDCG